MTGLSEGASRPVDSVDCMSFEDDRWDGMWGSASNGPLAKDRPPRPGPCISEEEAQTLLSEINRMEREFQAKDPEGFKICIWLGPPSNKSLGLYTLHSADLPAGSAPLDAARTANEFCLGMLEHHQLLCGRARNAAQMFYADVVPRWLCFSDDAARLYEDSTSGLRQREAMAALLASLSEKNRRSLADLALRERKRQESESRQLPTKFSPMANLGDTEASRAMFTMKVNAQLEAVKQDIMRRRRGTAELMARVFRLLSPEQAQHCAQLCTRDLPDVELLVELALARARR